MNYHVLTVPFEGPVAVGVGSTADSVGLSSFAPQAVLQITIMQCVIFPTARKHFTRYSTYRGVSIYKSIRIEYWEDVPVVSVGHFPNSRILASQ